jgi:[ribosomal protein S18]-alanine N-acetyltransferase
VNVAASRSAPYVARMTDADAAAVVELSRITQSRVDLEAERLKAYSQVWVARLGVTAPAVAYALVWLVADELQIVDLATHPSARRQGAARALLEALIAFARGLSFQCVLLEVRASNAPALALYQQAGFTEARTRRGYYSDGEDACEMALFLVG